MMGGMIGQTEQVPKPQCNITLELEKKLASKWYIMKCLITLYTYSVGIKISTNTTTGGKHVNVFEALFVLQ